MDRRNFVFSASACLAGALASSALTLAQTRPRRKKILVLGGTNFVGPAVVEAALLAGHEVTLANRRLTNPDLFPHLEHLVAYRSSDLTDQNLGALASRRWDAVVDVWPFEPEIVEATAKLLRDRTDHYLYVSSTAAYEARGFAHPGLTEDAPLNTAQSDARPYAKGKAESERRLSSIFGDRLTIVRPVGITGYRDDGAVSLHVWLVRAQSGGEHVAPGDGTDPVQFVDVKDVAEFLVTAIDKRHIGVFNLARHATSFRDFLSSCSSSVQGNANFVWVARDFLAKAGLGPGASFPYWASKGYEGASQVSCERAIAVGWSTREFKVTARDCLLWYWELKAAQISDENGRKEALTSAKEEEILRLWRS